MSGQFFIRQIARLFAEADKHSDEDRIHLQLRALAGKGLLSPIPNLYGPKGALYYPEREVYRARLLIAAVDLGIAGQNLIKLDSALSHRLDDAIRGAAASIDWRFEIVFIRLVGSGEIGVNCGWIANGNRFGRESDPLALQDAGFAVDSLAGSIETVTIILFSRLARPVRELIEAQ